MNVRKPHKLPELPADTECISYSNRTSAHVSEMGVGATFLNKRRIVVRVIRYDDCYNTARDVRQADYIIGMQAVGDVILELKGSNLDRAVSQFEETLGRWRTDPVRFEPIACLIVFGSRIPRITTRTAVLEREFYLSHRAFLWIRESASEKFKIRKLLRKTNDR